MSFKLAEYMTGVPRPDGYYSNLIIITEPYSFCACSKCSRLTDSPYIYQRYKTNGHTTAYYNACLKCIAKPLGGMEWTV